MMRKIGKQNNVAMKMETENAQEKKCEASNICAVCGQYCFYYYYGTQCCEGCKQFFRRCVVKLKMYRCPRNKKCAFGEGHYCRGCRLNKCLLAGMMPRYVKVIEINENIEKFFELVEQKRIGLLQAQIQNPNLLEKTKEKALLNLLMELERSFKKYWDSSKSLPEEYLNKFENVVDLLENRQQNLLAKNQFCNKQIEKWNKEKVIQEIEHYGIFASYLTNCVVKDWFVCIEFAKSIPFFVELNLSDQVNLLKHIIQPMISLCSAYYSHKISAQTFTRADGFSEISILQANSFKDDERLRLMLIKALSDPVDRIAQVDLEHDEFLLLMAILTASSSADNLSASGRELLYAESVKNTRALQNMLKSKHGHFGGVQKFSSLMIMLTQFHNSKNILRNISIYLEIFYEKRDPQTTFPKILLPFVSN